MDSFHFHQLFSKSWPVIRITPRDPTPGKSLAVQSGLGRFYEAHSGVWCAAKIDSTEPKVAFLKEQQPWVHPPQCHPPPQPHLPSKSLAHAATALSKLIFISSHLINSGRLELSQHLTLAGAVPPWSSITTLSYTTVFLLLIWRVTMPININQFYWYLWWNHQTGHTPSLSNLATHTSIMGTWAYLYVTFDESGNLGISHFQEHPVGTS